jgi:putative ABC transport system permease protein
MKFLRLIIRNAGRNKRRTILTVLSVAVAVFLLATMRSVGTTLDDISKPSGAATRLIVQRTTSLADAMPEAFEAKIKQVPGVAAVCPANWFGGTYIENKPEYAFAQFYVDPREIFDVHTEWQISPEEKAAFQQERAAAFCGKKLADKFGWKLGDVIELQGTFLPVHPQLTLRGIYTVPEKPTEEDQLLFHRPYVEEAMNRPGLVGTFRIRLQTSADAAAVSEAVDQLFYNSSAPTKTQTEAAFAASFVSMLGNVKTLITAIGAIVVFTIVLIAANSMAMTARERFTEIAVMKALGFQPGLVLALMLTESVFIALIGGVLGAGAAKVIFSFTGVSENMFLFLQNFEVLPTTVLLGLAASVLIGVFAGGIPALNAARVRIVDGLRRVA